MNSDNLFCELFVDCEGDREKLQSLIAEIMNGSQERFGVIKSDIFSIVIKNNELHNSQSYGGEIPEENNNTRPYYYKYRINIEPADNDVVQSKYLDGLKKIVDELNKHGVKLFLSPNILQRYE